ncbi:MAG: HAD family phosphatase [Anaerovoracaceae bacterium]
MPSTTSIGGCDGDKMNIKGAIFDLDGTLLDSMFIWDSIGENYLISRGITPEKGLNEKFKTMSIVQAAEYYRETYGLTECVQEIVDGVNGMIDHLYANVVATKDGVPELLEKLRSNGVKMCVATATDRYMVESALRHNNIFHYFSGILTCTEVGIGKDNPEIFEQALKLLDTKKHETLVFEDAVHAIETAKKAKFKVVGVFDRSSIQAQEKIKEMVDYYALSLSELCIDEY